MPEVWIQPNRRALSTGLVVPLGLLTTGVLLLNFVPREGWWWFLIGTAWVSIALAAIVGGVLVILLKIPRVAYDSAALLVYLGSWQPFRVPIEHVECFFLGNGSSDIRVGKAAAPQTSTIVVRIAESASEYQQRDAKAALGQWCGGYIVLRGTWCEPITAELLTALNKRLTKAHSDRKKGDRKEGDRKELETPRK